MRRTGQPILLRRGLLRGGVLQRHLLLLRAVLQQHLLFRHRANLSEQPVRRPDLPDLRRPLQFLVLQRQLLPEPSVCQNNQCVAPTCLNCGGSSSPSCCGGTSRDIQLDDDNCGACGHSCKAAAQCFGGRCVCPASARDTLALAPKCDDPDMLCCASEDGEAALCIDVRNNDNNCGGCRIDCTKSGKKCVDKVCVGGCDPFTCKTACCSEGTYPLGEPFPAAICCPEGQTVCCASTTLADGITTSKCCPPSNGNCCARQV